MLAALLVSSASASAHPPLLASGAAWTASGPSALAARTNRGLVIASDEGVRLLCPMALGAFPNEQLPLVAADEGGWLVATSQGVLHIDARGCRDPGGARLVAKGVAGLVTSGDGGVYAITADSSSGSALFRSEDSGKTFELMVQLPDRQFFNSLVVDGSGSEVYLAGQRLNEQNQVSHFMGSFSAGATQLQPIELQPEEALVRVLAVDPTQPDVVVAGAFVSSTSSEPSRLLRSDDAGRSWSTWQAVPSLQQMSFSSDGQTAWLASAAGLWRSDAGGPFTPLPLERPPSCVVASGNQLLVCDSLGLQTTRDDARTFEPLLRFADVTSPVSCDSSGRAVLECSSDWQEFSSEITRVFADDSAAPAAAAEPTPAVATETGAPRSGTSSCALTTTRTAEPPGLASLLAAAALYRRRRCNRKRPSPH